jgi:hypothetical protein
MTAPTLDIVPAGSRVRPLNLPIETARASAC